MDKNLSKFVKFVISENIALAAMSYFEQVFAFCMLITKNLPQWFLLMFKEDTLRRSTNLFSRNHPTLFFVCLFFCFCFVFLFLINKRKFADAQNWSCFIKLTKASTGGCSIKKAVLKTFAIFTGKHLSWSLFFDFIKKRLQHRSFTVMNCLRTPILKNTAYGCFWTDFRKRLFHTLFLDSTLQNHPAWQYYKNTSRFQIKAINTIWRVFRLYI